jgi:hypothetical protein
VRIAALLPEARRQNAGRLKLVPARAEKINCDGGFMKVKFGLFVVGFAFLFGAAAQAQERQLIDVGVSYSYVRYNPGTQGIKGFSIRVLDKDSGEPTHVAELVHRAPVETIRIPGQTLGLQIAG